MGSATNEQNSGKGPKRGKGEGKSVKDKKEKTNSGVHEQDLDLEDASTNMVAIEKELSNEKLERSKPVVTPEFIYSKELTLEEIKEIYDLFSNLEDAARYLAKRLGLADCIFDARNLILLEYCLGNLMFAKRAGLNFHQSRMIYTLGHMILDFIRDGSSFAHAEKLFKNRLLSLSIVHYPSGPPLKHDTIINDESREENNSKGTQIMQNDNEKHVKNDKGKGKEKDKKTSDKISKSKEDKKTTESVNNKLKSGENLQRNKMEDSKDENVAIDIQQGPLFSLVDVQKIGPYFASTVFQHYCLYQYCFTRVHYNITRKERVLIEVPMTYPLSEAKSQEEVDKEESTRLALLEKDRQDAHAAKVRAEQDLFDAIAAEGKRFAEEELKRKALTLDEYIELSVRNKIEDAKKAIMDEFEYREHLLVDKIVSRKTPNK